MKKKRNNGIALVFVLIFTVAICTMVIFFHGKTIQYMDIFSGTQQAFLLENIAETGIEIGKSIIATDWKTYDMVPEESPALKQKEYCLGDFNLRLKITDENAKINPNSLSEDEKSKINALIHEVFKRLFTVLGYPETMSASILDWIDEDGLQRPGGAESFYYATAGFPYTPPNRNLYYPEEILLIKDFTEDVVFGNPEDAKKGLINFITSFSDGKINVNTCEPEVLSALGFPHESVEKIVAERQKRPIEERFVIGVNREAFLKNKSIISFKSDYFLIESSAIDPGGRKKQVRAYVKRIKKELKIVRMEIR